MTRYYKDIYGCTASITEDWTTYHLRVSNAYGQRILSKRYTTFRGARIAMGKMSDCWREIKED